MDGSGRHPGKLTSSIAYAGSRTRPYQKTARRKTHKKLCKINPIATIAAIARIEDHFQPICEFSRCVSSQNLFADILAII
jgi:hypothetical protein